MKNSDSMNLNSGRTRKSKFVIYFTIGVILALFIGFIRASDKFQPKIRPAIAEVYEWPLGCSQKDYQQFDRISVGCIQKKYVISRNASDNIGLSTRSIGRQNVYHRLGNDAAYFKCSGNYCKIKKIYKNSFYQE